jgi:hypothetical protein
MLQEFASPAGRRHRRHFCQKLVRAVLKRGLLFVRQSISEIVDVGGIAGLRRALLSTIEGGPRTSFAMLSTCSTSGL